MTLGGVLLSAEGANWSAARGEQLDPAVGCLVLRVDVSTWAAATTACRLVVDAPRAGSLVF